MARQLIGRMFGSLVGVAVFIALVVLTTATIVVAGIGGQNGIIQGCATSGGDLRVIDAAVGTCRQNETAISWSQWGIIGYEVITSETVVVPPYVSVVKRVNCTPGKKVLSGGFHSNNVRVIQSFPQLSGTAPGWQVYVQSNGADSGSFNVYAICAMATP